MVKTASYFFFRTLLILFILFMDLSAQAQRYNFQHYDVPDGLSQSQVLAICQDKQKQIWVSTFGGINCFDGQQFNAYTTVDGLATNANFALACDNSGNIWCAGAEGVTAFKSSGLVRYSFNKPLSFNGMSKILCDRNNDIWILAGKRLYQLLNNQLIVQQLSSSKEVVTEIELDPQKNIYAAVYQSGFYSLSNAHWNCVIPLTKNHYIAHFIFDHEIRGRLYFMTSHELYQYDADHPTKIVTPVTASQKLVFYCLLQDATGKIWIGTSTGAMAVKNRSVQLFNESNGFTNNGVFSLFCDSDKRIWLGTDGAGLYCYVSGDFITYDTSQGLSNNVVMSIAQGLNGQIYLGTNGGLLSFYHNIVKQEMINGSMSSMFRINTMVNENNGNLLVGTDNFGLWRGHLVKGKLVYSPYIKTSQLNFTQLAVDGKGLVWAATSIGCFYIESGQLKMIPLFHQYCTSLITKGDSILVGTTNGLYLVRDKKIDPAFKLPEISNKNILCLKSYGSFVLVGTNDNGLFLCNMKTKAIKNLTIRSGLSSNTIYSIDIISRELWVGTGKGVEKFRIEDPVSMNLTKEYLFNFICETNLNAIFHTDTSIWVGTAHGVNVYPVSKSRSSPLTPNTVIQNVGLTTADAVGYIYKNGYKLPENLSLPSNKSHITIKFHAIDFTNEKNAYYQYKLDGADKDYCKPIQSNVVDYPNLSPGSYTFRVRALNAFGAFKNTAAFSFVITPTFTQRAIFKILLFITFVALAYCFYLYKHYKSIQNLKYIEALKLREQDAVRRQTAEDFHDDLGNKLTRINMLSELLDKQIGNDKPDEKLLVQQIRSSALELYAGTKNILWALNPNNDNLYYVFDFIEKFGMDLFSDAKIHLNVSPIDPKSKKIRFPLGFGRNIILICKELMHNTLKHSNATSVTLSFNLTSDGYICIRIADNGNGFAYSETASGNGIRNMNNRAKRLNGELVIKSSIGRGTDSQLIFPISNV